MSTSSISLNNPQLISVINNAKSQVDIHGRGTGKSYVIGWEMQEIVRTMPRSITSITGRTYGQVLTRTLPSTMKFLEKVGYIKGRDYVIGTRPPKHFKDSYEKINKYDNFISFLNGTGFLLLSQEREGSSRGPNLDREIVDEALTLIKTRYDEEVSPANRGNEEYFGNKTRKPIRKHHGFRYVSSMPFSQDQKWLLDFAAYYEEERGIQLFDLWNRIVKLQLLQIQAQQQHDVKLFKELWLETKRLKAKITPFTSKSGLLFTLANAFDNIENLGFSYVVREYEKQNLLTFLIEILNWIVDKVEDCYYHLDPQKHIYYDATNDEFIASFAQDSGYDADLLSAPDCRFDLDCNPSLPLEVTPDWGSSINLFTVGQERNYNFVSKLIEPVDCFINEFYNKPQETNIPMINELVQQFNRYYKEHPTKEITYYRDRYGDSRQPNVKNSNSFNNQAIEQFEKYGWIVVSKSHRGQEPPQHDKYLLWMNILKGADARFPRVIFNGKKCKYTLISMNNTKVIERNGKFQKDKSSERSKKILPEEATHFSDSVDKRIWTKYGELLLRYQSSFVDARL